jgi:hypothetical protein
MSEELPQASLPPMFYYREATADCSAAAGKGKQHDYGWGGECCQTQAILLNGAVAGTNGFYLRQPYPQLTLPKISLTAADACYQCFI